MTQGRAKVGQKGQVVIPKEIRDKVGIREGSEVLVSTRDNEDEIVIRRSSPPTQSYVDYYIATYCKKLKRQVNIKKLIEDETIERFSHLR
jgi:AbrB family looped-hinge helix DNA binding protein